MFDDPMAIKTLSKNTDMTKNITLLFDNGDYGALETIKEKWKFKDEESLLKFALAVLLKAEHSIVTIRSDSGQDVPLKPSENLLLRD